MTDTTQAPERIFAAKSNSTCVVSFTTPSEDYYIEYIRADLAPDMASIVKPGYVVDEIYSPDGSPCTLFEAITLRSAVKIRNEALEEAAQVALLISQDGEYHGDASVCTSDQIYQCGAADAFEHIRALKSCALAEKDGA